MKPVLIVLACSLVVNLFLWDAQTKAVRQAAEAKESARQAKAAADACTDSVEGLQAQARQRAAQARPKVEAARDGMARATRNAYELLASPPAVAGDDCGSARVRIDQWLDRRQPSAP